MANFQELSSSISYTSPSHNSIGSSEPANSSEIVSLNKLSGNLGSLLVDGERYDFTDAEIEVEGLVVGVHRCILAARSTFFYELFKGGGGGTNTVKPRYSMKDLLPFGHVGHDVFMEFLWYLYTGKLRQADPDVLTCMDGDCTHEACLPAVNFVVELMYASYYFEIVELISLLQRRLLNFVEKAFVEEVIPILLVAFHTQQNQLIEHCAHKVAHSDLDDTALVKLLPLELSERIKSLHCESQSSGESVVAPANSIRIEGTKKIHKALDLDDVELVKMLLKESDITLNDANALHYAAAYCDSKIVAEIFELGMSDVNLKNARGHTPLHIAAMRMEPEVIMELIRKGASVSASLVDGRNAISICRRLTRPKDYNASRETYKESNRRRICIDILEQELKMPIAREESMESVSSSEDLQIQHEDLKTRVAFAQLIFPTEAKLAMKIAEIESKRLDLNETATQVLQANINVLKRTVKFGRRYFPHCSKYLDNLIDDDSVPELWDYEQGGPDQQELKRRRFYEIKEDLLEAFSKDMARKDHKSDKSLSGDSSLSSSLSPFTRNKRQSRIAKN